MNTDNVVEFLRQLSLDVSLGAAAQQAASQRDAPLALARGHGARAACSAADWSAFTRGCLDESNASLTDIEAADAVIWQLVQDPGQGSRVEASSVTRVIGILAQDGAPPVVGQVVSDLAPRARRRVRPSSPVPEASIPRGAPR